MNANDLGKLAKATKDGLDGKITATQQGGLKVKYYDKNGSEVVKVDNNWYGAADVQNGKPVPNAKVINSDILNDNIKAKIVNPIRSSTAAPLF